MKKTLITLMALGSVALAGVDGDWTGTFSWGADAPLTFTFTDENGAALNSPLSITLTPDKDYKVANAHVGVYSPDTNVGSGNPWALTWTLTNVSNEALDITGMSVDVILYDSNGNQQPDQTTRALTLTLTGGIEGAVSFISWNGVEKTYTLDFSKDSYYLEAGKSLTMTLTAAKDESYSDTAEYMKGTYVGLTGATFTLIPEPATATLSLLALCGLAARRRRR